MEEKSLAISFSDSLSSDVADGLSEFCELAIDSIMDEGLLKELPIFSTAISLYRIGGSIKERYSLKKLAVFVDQIRRGCADKENLQKYQHEFSANANFRSKELEHILILLDRYVSLDKPRMLAKLYLAYLDGVIIWEEFSMYAEVVDRFLLLDCRTLTTESEETIVPRGMIGGESVLRLVALGLMMEVTDYSTYIKEPNGHYRMTWGTLEKSISPDKTYKRTEFGEKLACILR